MGAEPFARLLFGPRPAALPQTHRSPPHPHAPGPSLLLVPSLPTTTSHILGLQICP